MKKLSFIIFCAFIFLSTHSYGQTNVSVAFSQQRKTSKNTNILASGEVGNNIYVIKRERNEYSMLIYDAKLKLLKESSFKKRNCKDGDCIDAHFDYKKTLFFEDKILVFFVTQDRATKNQLLLCQTFNPEGEFVGELKTVDTMESAKKSSYFMIEHNQAKNKFVVIQDPKESKKTDEKFMFKVYDADLNNLSNSAIELPYRDKKTSVVNYFLSNKGDVYMLLKISLMKSQKEKNEDGNSFSLLSLECSADNSLSEYKFQLSQKYVKSIDLQINDIDQTVSCAGLYSLKTTGWKGIDGMFFLNIDMNSKKILSESYKSFDKEMVRRLLGMKEGKQVKDTKGIQSTFAIKNFIKQPDGSGYIIAENNFVRETRRCNANGVCVVTYVYYSLNILAIKVSSKGEILNLTDIPKYQIAASPTYQSFLAMQKDNRVLLIYNDDPKNLTPDASTIRDVKKFTKQKKGALILAELFPDGKYSKALLFKNKDKKLAAEPKNGFMLKDGVYIVPTNGNSNTFGIIKFDVK